MPEKSNEKVPLPLHLMAGGSYRLILDGENVLLKPQEGVKLSVKIEVERVD